MIVKTWLVTDVLQSNYCRHFACNQDGLVRKPVKVGWWTLVHVILRYTKGTTFECRQNSETNFFLFYGLTALVGLNLLIVEVSRSHFDAPHLVGLLWTRDRPVAETSTWQHTQHSKETDIHSSDGIRTRNCSKRAAADSRLRPRVHGVTFQNIVILSVVYVEVFFIGVWGSA